MTEHTEVTQAIWERQPGEPARWYARFLLYRGMGAGRSLLACFHREEALKSTNKHYNHVPGSWSQACERWNWKARAEAYDADQQAQAEERRRVLLELEQAEIERILTTGYALMHKRIEGLSKMAELVELSFLEKDKETNEAKINFAWVTPDKIREYRGCLDDIAKELGQRIKKSEIAGKDGGPIKFITEWAGGALPEESENEG